MSYAGELGALLYEAESTFGEDVTTFATHRIPMLGPIDATGLKHDKLEPGRIIQYLQDGTAWILGPQGGSFRTRMHVPGHGSATTGATSADALETFWSYVFGKVTVGAASGTTVSGGTATALTTVASGTFTPGSIFRLGVLGDARGGGQAGVVSTHSGTTLTSLTTFAAAGSGTDVCMPCVNLYIPESASDSSTSVTGLRFLAMTANLKYELHGCYPTGAKLVGTNPNELPVLEIDWGVSWWRYSTTGTFPSAVTSNQYAPTPNATGSMFLNDVGTATRATRTYRSFSVDLGLGCVPLVGPGGANQYQSYVGARRVPSTIKVAWTEDADTATATPVLDGYFTATTRKHMLVTLSTANGASVAIYFPNLCITGARPVQQVSDRINRIGIEAMAYTGGTTTSELTLSAMRIGLS